MAPPKDRSRHLDVLEINGLRATIVRAGRLLLEAVVVPTVLLAILLHVIGTTRSILVAVGWCVLAISLRWYVDRRLPGTLLLGSAALAVKAAIALASGSILIYLLQPVLGSIVMALLFLGSAAFGRPITLRLARDFVHVPAHILDKRGVRRMFTEVAVIWGSPGSRRRAQPRLPAPRGGRRAVGPRPAEPAADRARGRRLHGLGLALASP
jgi:hypothetical protein